MRVFLFVGYGCELEDAAHRAAVLIDNAKRKIFLIDPNGRPSYFNKIHGTNMEFAIDTMLSKYFAKLQKFGVDYKYVHSNVWNKKNIYLNKRFHNTVVGSGHYVPLTYILIHILSAGDYDILFTYELLKMLSDEELLFLIKNYSLGIYNLFHHKG